MRPLLVLAPLLLPTAAAAAATSMSKLRIPRAAPFLRGAETSLAPAARASSGRPAIPNRRLRTRVATTPQSSASFTIEPVVATKDGGRRYLSVQKQRYSSKDWASNLKSLLFFQSNVFKRIFGHLFFNVLLAVAAQLWWTYSPENFYSISTVPHTLTGAALSLFLVFRTHAAYERFWEARRRIGEMTDHVRDLARLAPEMYPVELSKRFGRLLCAFGYLLRLHLQGMQRISVKEADPEVMDMLRTEDIAEIEGSPSRPLACVHLLSKMAHSPEARGYGDRLEFLPERQGVEKSLYGLIQTIGSCERVLGTPVPLSYSRHTSRFLTLWAATLPLVLTPVLGWTSVPVIAAMCWGLFSIEEVGHTVEEPFGMPTGELGFRRLCGVARRDVINSYAQRGLSLDLPVNPLEPIRAKPKPMSMPMPPVPKEEENIDVTPKPKPRGKQL